MGEDSTKGLSNVIRIDDERIQDHLKHVVRGSVEDTLNALLEAEADQLCRADRIGHQLQAQNAKDSGHYLSMGLAARHLDAWLFQAPDVREIVEHVVDGGAAII